jgi:3-carboxy-cis,cis-muconate cycloisomerase
VTPFEPIFVPQPLREAVSDDAWLGAMLAAERALASVEAGAGVIPADAAAAIAECCRAELYDPGALAEQGRGAGNPAAALVDALRARVGGDAARFVHFGATSQDIVDTAAALVARDATVLVLEELDGVARACATLADENRTTLVAARTLLQQAVPTTLGLKAASWLVGVVHARGRLAAARLPAQLGGAGGTLASLGDRGIEVLHAYAQELDLAEPVVPWHSRRLPVAELGSALAVAAGFCAKIALDVALLAQTEVAEALPPEGGTSSTMPHKRNPVGSALARACAAHTRAAAAVLLDLEHEHERAAGAWHAEWKALRDALAYAGGAAASLRTALDGLEIDAERMRGNVTTETLSEAERFAPDVHRPEDYLGAADAFVDRALGFYRR